MFQIVCALALEVPSVLQDIESLHGVSSNVSLSCEPWGHIDYTGKDCTCLSSDSTGAYGCWHLAAGSWQHARQWLRYIKRPKTERIRRN